MAEIPLLSVWRSFRFKALFVVTNSMALIIAVLYFFSTTWLKRERMSAETERATILMNHVATNLRLGVTVQSAELIRPVVESAFLANEVAAIAVFDKEGNLLGQHARDEALLKHLAQRGRRTRLTERGPVQVTDADHFWVLATPVEKSSAPSLGAAPADFLVVSSETRGEAIGSVWVYWDMTAVAEGLARFHRRFLLFSVEAFLLVAVPTWIMTRYLNRGVSELRQATKHVEQGNFQYRIGSTRSDELGDVMRAFDAMVERTAETNAQLQEERARALDASKAKSDFLANMSHELRTPLNAIIGFSELLMEPAFGVITDKQRSYVTDILDSGKHLLSLINDILDLAKIESGRMQFEPRRVDLPALLGSCMRLISERAAKHRIELTTDIAPGVTTIVADERKLKQLVFNLLSNAVKFTPDGGKVGIRAYAIDEAVQICVSDSGIGIPESEHALIFEEFYQVRNSCVQRQQGTGLGLPLVKKLAQLHGGRVWVKSTVDVGSQFYVELPQPQPATQTGEAA